MTTSRQPGSPQLPPWTQRVQWAVFVLALVILASQLFGSHWRTAPSRLYLPLALVGVTGGPIVARRSITAQWVLLAITVVLLVLSIVARD